MSLGWRNQSGPIHAFRADRNPEPMSVVEKNPYILTLVSVDNDDGDIFGDITSTLEVMVDDVVNGTSITCAVFGFQGTLFLFQTGLEFIPQQS